MEKQEETINPLEKAFTPHPGRASPSRDPLLLDPKPSQGLSSAQLKQRAFL